VRNDGLDKPTVPEIYLSSGLVAVNPMHFIVRSPLPESTLLPEIRQAVQRVDPAQPVHSFAAMTEVVEGSLSLQRVSSFMTGFFAMAAYRAMGWLLLRRVIWRSRALRGPLRESADVVVPVTAGLLRSVVILPVGGRSSNP